VSVAQTNLTPNQPHSPEPVSVAKALSLARTENASDLHVLGDEALRLRVSTKVGFLPFMVPREGVTEYVATLRERNRAADAKMKRFGAFDMREVDAHGGAFRLHVYQDGSGLRLHMRLLGERAPEFSSLHLPPIIASFAEPSSGLVLIVGPQRMGKTHLLHALVDIINSRGGRTIHLIEYPKEFHHVPGSRSVLAQIEPGPELHVNTYERAVVNAMNSDTDVIAIGQITSYGEAAATVDAARRGALVFGTIHGRNATQGIEALLSWFPPEEVPRIRADVATTLIGAVSLRLLPSARGAGVVPVAEVLNLKTDSASTIQGLIRRGETAQIRQHMEQHGAQGNKTLERAMNELIASRAIRREDAVKEAVFPDEVRNG